MANPSVQLSKWVQRILAAIGVAEGYLAEVSPSRDYRFILPTRSAITVGEVALAKALWATGPCKGQGPSSIDSHCDAGGCDYEPAEEPALRAFTEKVEAL